MQIPETGRDDGDDEYKAHVLSRVSFVYFQVFHNQRQVSINPGNKIKEDWKMSLTFQL